MLAFVVGDDAPLATRSLAVVPPGEHPEYTDHERRLDWDRRVARDVGEISQHLKDIDGNFASLITKLATDKTESNREWKQMLERVNDLHDEQMQRRGQQKVINYLLGGLAGVLTLVEIVHYSGITIRMATGH